MPSSATRRGSSRFELLLHVVQPPLGLLGHLLELPVCRLLFAKEHDSELAHELPPRSDRTTTLRPPDIVGVQHLGRETCRRLPGSRAAQYRSSEASVPSSGQEAQHRTDSTPGHPRDWATTMGLRPGVSSETNMGPRAESLATIPGKMTGPTPIRTASERAFTNARTPSRSTGETPLGTCDDRLVRRLPLAAEARKGRARARHVRTTDIRPHR